MTSTPRRSTNPVPRRGVAPQTIHRRLTVRADMPGHLVHQLPVAGEAVGPQDARVVVGNLDRFVEVLEGEIERVPEAVPTLGRVLADQVVRHVAVVTGGDRMMAGLLPTV